MNLNRERPKLFLLATVWPASFSIYREIYDQLRKFGNGRLLIIEILTPNMSNLSRVVLEENFEIFQFTPHSALEGIFFRDERDFERLRELVLERIPEGTPAFALTGK
jgi:hypothetical protein